MYFPSRSQCSCWNDYSAQTSSTSATQGLHFRYSFYTKASRDDSEDCQQTLAVDRLVSHWWQWFRRCICRTCWRKLTDNTLLGLTIGKLRIQLLIPSHADSLCFHHSFPLAILPTAMADFNISQFARMSVTQTDEENFFSLFVPYMTKHELVRTFLWGCYGINRFLLNF